KKVIDLVVGPPALSRFHRAVIVDQTRETVGVKTRDADAPAATAKPVPVWFGLPGFAAKFNASSNPEIMLSFNGGREDGAFSTLFPTYPQGVSETPPPYPIEYLSFLGGSQPIARRGDRVTCGKYILSNLPPAPGGIPTGLLIQFAPNDESLPEFVGTI